MPGIFLLLIWESRQIGPLRHPRPSPGWWAILVLLGAAALASMVAAGLFAVSLGWSHSLVAFTLTAAFVAAVLAALVALDAPTESYLMNLAAASQTAVSVERLHQVLTAIAPIVGTARVVSATSRIMEVLRTGA